jgi:NAD(P) transhydrogenase subunit alpha
MSPVWLVIIFIISTAAGYKLIKNVPSLLHTPLMSGMNAISGITVLGAILAAATAAGTGSKLLAGLAVILATVNMVSGFGVTSRMLNMFKRAEPKEGGRS